MKKPTPDLLTTHPLKPPNSESLCPLKPLPRLSFQPIPTRRNVLPSLSIPPCPGACFIVAVIRQADR